MSDSGKKGEGPVHYAAIEALPPNFVGEIVGGTLQVTPRPAPAHAMAASGLGALIGGPFHYGSDGPGGWWIFFEPELHLGADLLVPDLAGWRRGRLEAPRAEPYFSLAPDWICEVVSPKTASLDRVEKLPIYAREEVHHAWLVDPLARSLEVFNLVGAQLAFHQGWTGDQLVRAAPFEAIELDLSRLWIPDSTG